jgi:hypothetical protein
MHLRIASFLLFVNLTGWLAQQPLLVTGSSWLAEAERSLTGSCEYLWTCASSTTLLAVLLVALVADLFHLINSYSPTAGQGEGARPFERPARRRAGPLVDQLILQPAYPQELCYMLTCLPTGRGARPSRRRQAAARPPARRGHRVRPDGRRCRQSVVHDPVW